jgi:hypothetical protein
MNKIPLEDSAAIVNFFEGEGYIGIRFDKNQNDSGLLAITITNTNKEKLDWIQKILGIGKVKLHSYGIKNRKITYIFDLRVSEMEDFLKLLIYSKYLIIKKYPTLAMLEWFKETKKYSNTKGINIHHCERRITISESTTRFCIIEAMKLLNKRGRYAENELIELQKVKQYYDWYYEENYPY